jgi:hypothetical protein
MYRRTGSAYRLSVSGGAAGTMVLSICGGTSIDMVAVALWSATRSA